MIISPIAIFIGIIAIIPLYAVETEAIPVPFPVAHYQNLWIKSPFSVASLSYDPDSAEYELVGLGKVDEDVYASILEKQSGEIFVLSNNHSSHGLKLFKVHKGALPEDCYAILGRDEQSLTLHLRPASQAVDSQVPPATTDSTTPKPLPTATLAPESQLPHSLSAPASTTK